MYIILRSHLRAISSSLFASNPKISSSFILKTKLNSIARQYADIAPKKSKLVGSGTKIKEFPVESDTRKLQEYCCGSNILKDGEDVKLKPESEYPEWLWTLHIGPPKTLDQLDPNTKEYWERVRLEHEWRHKAMHKFRTKILKKF